MRATCSIEASTYAKARELATKAFAEFFGDQSFEITCESAEATVATLAGKFVWDCRFEAVAA